MFVKLWPSDNKEKIQGHTFHSVFKSSLFLHILLRQMLKFWNLSQTPRSQGQNTMASNFLTIRNSYTKYENPKLLNQETLPRLWFLKSRSKVKVTRLQTLIPKQKSYYKECINEIWESYHLPFKSSEQGSSFRQYYTPSRL